MIEIALARGLVLTLVAVLLGCYGGRRARAGSTILQVS
jgi:hypothetical protein